MSDDKLVQNFKTMKELRQYCNSQYRVINELNKRIVSLEEENKHLKDLLTRSTPILDNSSGSLEIYKDLSDELATCLMQIKILKEKSLAGELTFEDTKKLEIYTKLLISLRDGKEKGDEATKALSDDELLKLVTDELSK